MNLFAPPSPRSVLQITGTDASSFLQGMISNDMELLEKTPAIYAALLSPQGKVISTFFVVNNPDGGFWLDCPSQAFADLYKRLKMFRLRADVVMRDVSDDLQVALSEQKTDGICFADPRNPALGFRNICKIQALPALHTDQRFSHIIPEQDLDFASGEVFASDINMDLQNGIAWRKGCYVGQEVVSRMRRRGTIRKRICLAEFAQTPPLPGADIYAGSAKIGRLCSSHGQQALALIRTDRLQKAQEQGQTLICGELSLTITAPKEIAK